MKYLAVLGRQPEISMAELEAVLGNLWAGSAVVSSPTSRLRSAGVPQATSPAYVTFLASSSIDIRRLGGVLKLGVELDGSPIEYLKKLPEGKVTIGVSDYSRRASRKSAVMEALKLKKILVRHGRSVRVVENKEAVLSTATSLHNGLSGKNPRKVELIKTDEGWFRVIGVQDIDAYSRRDQARPARDAKVGMLPPKLAQILINLCGPLESEATVLDPFCGTGVVLQEALLMGYRAYGTDISERMVEYSKKNLRWLLDSPFEGTLAGCCRECRKPSPVKTGARTSGPEEGLSKSHDNRLYYTEQGFRENERFLVEVGDATSCHWEKPIDAVACEGYLGKPFSRVPTEIELKEQMQECSGIVLGFLRNLAGQVEAGTPVTIAVPAWLRSDGRYKRMDILDGISDMGYNVNNKSREGLLYCREGQIVARDILILRKK